MCIKNKLSLKLVTFDATNTLLKFKMPPWVYYTDVARCHGFKGSQEDVKINLLKSLKQMASVYPNFGKGSIHWESWWRQVIQNTFVQLPHKMENVDVLATTLINDFKTSKCWQLATGTNRLLAYLKTDKELKLGIISNFDPRLHDIMKNLGIHSQLDFITTSYDLGESKPSPSIFEHSRKTFAPLASVSECLHVGDDLEKDYKGAQGAGWHAVLISEKIKENNNNIPYYQVFGSFEDFVHTVTSNKLKLNKALNVFS